DLLSRARSHLARIHRLQMVHQSSSQTTCRILWNQPAFATLVSEPLARVSSSRYDLSQATSWLHIIAWQTSPTTTLPQCSKRRNAAGAFCRVAVRKAN